MRAPLRRLCGALAIGLGLGCAGGPDAAPPPAAQALLAPSGFLGDYSALRPGGKSRARLVYLDANVDFSAYERVIVDPVVVWKSDEARFAGVSSAQREALARELQAALERAFAREFVAAEAPGPGTLRIRNALTALIAQDSDPERLQYVEAEIELRDAVTNARVAAAVDSRGTRPSGTGEAPPALESAAVFEEWAERAAYRLGALRDIDRRLRELQAP